MQEIIYKPNTSAKIVLLLQDNQILIIEPTVLQTNMYQYSSDSQLVYTYSEKGYILGVRKIESYCIIYLAPKQNRIYLVDTKLKKKEFCEFKFLSDAVSASNLIIFEDSNLYRIQEEKPHRISFYKFPFQFLWDFEAELEDKIYNANNQSKICIMDKSKQSDFFKFKILDIVTKQTIEFQFLLKQINYTVLRVLQFNSGQYLLQSYYSINMPDSWIVHTQKYLNKQHCLRPCRFKPKEEIVYVKNFKQQICYITYQREAKTQRFYLFDKESEDILTTGINQLVFVNAEAYRQFIEDGVIIYKYIHFDKPFIKVRTIEQFPRQRFVYLHMLHELNIHSSNSLQSVIEAFEQT